MEESTSPARPSATSEGEALLGSLRELLEDYAATLPKGQPVRTLPALLHAMPAIDALVAVGVARGEIAAVAQQTLAPLAAQRPGAAREVRVPVHRIYRAITIANAASGRSPILRSRGLVPYTEPTAPAADAGGHGLPEGEARTYGITATSAMTSATPALGEGATIHVRATTTPTSEVEQRRQEKQGHAVDPPAQRVLSGIRQQSRNRRLPPRDEFDPYDLDAGPPAPGVPPTEDDTCKE